MAKFENKEDITPEVLRELLDYDPLTGLFTWKPRDSSWFDTEQGYKCFVTRFEGKPALTSAMNGYAAGRVLGFMFKAHRVAFAVVTLMWPDQVDHINGVTTDNRWVNLRDATCNENLKNQAIYYNNTSGVTGVCWNKRTSKWQAYIKVNGKHIYIYICTMANPKMTP